MPWLLLFLLTACGSTAKHRADPTPTPEPTPSPSLPTPEGPRASVVGVTVSGGPQAYTFAVSVQSDDLGCDQYADWWEVVTPEGELIYRRILNHSHVDEQPFTRDGGPVAVGATDEVVVRAHLHPSGYVGDALRGTAEGGFGATVVEDGFGAELATAPPLPDDCWF